LAASRAVALPPREALVSRPGPPRDAARRRPRHERVDPRLGGQLDGQLAALALDQRLRDHHPR
jgi:hypothetical protein